MSVRETFRAVAEAVVRAEVAIKQLDEAVRAARGVLSGDHPAVHALVEAELAARAAKAKLDIVIKRIP